MLKVCCYYLPQCCYRKEATLNLTLADNSYSRHIILVRRCRAELNNGTKAALCIFERPRSEKPSKSQIV